MKEFYCYRCEKHIGSVPYNWPLPSTISYCPKCATKEEKEQTK